MEDPVANVLKDFKVVGNVTSFEERAELFEKLQKVLAQEPKFINSNVVKTVAKVIGSTLIKFKDKSSQALVKDLIISLLTIRHDEALEHLNSLFKVLATKELSSVSSSKAAKPAAHALMWTVLVVRHADHESNVFQTEFRNLILYQAALYEIVILGSNIRVIEHVEKTFFELWQDNEMFEKYFKRLIDLEASTEILLFLMLLVRFKNSEENKFLEQHKSKLLDHFVKAIIISKVKINKNLVINCRMLLNTVDEEDFNTKILPPLQRSMLRSPEIILENVGFIIKLINLNFDNYATQLGKVLLQNLYSKDDMARIDSVEGLKQLSIKCTKVQTVSHLLESIFAILNGSEGKITVAEYRINLLQGAGTLSYNSIPPENLSEILNVAVTNFSKTLSNEQTEKVICQALDMFSLWVKQFTGKLPEEIGNIIDKGLTLKTTTEQVRLSYLQWFLTALHKAQLENASKYHPFLLKIFEKAIQNPTQITLVSEAVCATCIILKTKMPNENDQLGMFWNTVMDLNKQIFFSERFLQAASIETLCHISLLAERLLTQYFQQLKGPKEVLFKTLMHCLVNSSSKVRLYMNDIIEEIIRSSDGVLFVKKILEAFEDSIDTIKVSEEADSQSGTEGNINSNTISDAICKLCAFENLSTSDAQNIALQSLLICHHPAATTNEVNLWENILINYLKLEPKSVISSNINKISDMLLKNYSMSKCYENSVTTIVRICPNVVLPTVINEVKTFFSNPELVNVNDDEFFTYLTPEGELYDKSVIPNSEDIYATTGLKRENKAYSYKEQLEELQLRREIEEKRRKEGKAKPPQFTPKQKEAIRNQEEKERLIRQRLKNLNDELMKHISMLKAACKGNAKQVSFYFCDLLNIILNTLCSPLSANSVSELYYFLHTTCFEEHQLELGEKISITTIRLSMPRCDLNEKWLIQELDEATIDCLMKLNALSVSTEEDHVSENDSDGNIELLSSPCFSYAFEFLKRAIISKCVTSQEDYLLYAIQILEAHAQLRGEDDRHPKYMPRYEMFNTLLQIITIHSGRVQAEAVAALLEVAKMSSGAENCAMLNQKDIELFLLALQHKMEVVRDVALRALKFMLNGVQQICEEDQAIAHKLACRLWIAKFDISIENRNLASEIWDLVDLQLPEWEMIFDDTVHPELCIQKATSAALVPLISGNDGLTKKVLKKLLSTYNEKLAMIPPKLDQFDRIVVPATDQYELRRGVAIVLAHIAQLFSLEEVNHCMQFMVSQGLGDRSEIVQKEMLAAALTIVDLHGKETIMHLLPVFEDFLDKAPKSQSFDNIRQSVVILMGSLARHLEKDDKRIEPIVRRLLSALSTPSQQVQEAVANCLPHLMPSVKDEAPAIIKKLLQTLVKSDKYGERRGAAYGIAGIVKGLGILSLKQLDIMAKLTTYIQEKKNYKSREGALFAFEVLCTTLGRLFEPYIVHVLPHLLQCFGDSSQYVRQAAECCCQVMMAKLSAHGVKLILPSLLDALDEDSWRTKTASVELLGAMAFCAPKQLSSCLPNIVPKLIEVLGDSHTKVQEAGGEALRVIGSVIKNPEIQAIVPVLLKALEDPSKNTSLCLHSLLKTKFVHFIDAPSLALIMPVVARAFLDRSTETRKMAAQIIGNMYSLTDQKDLTPYLPNIIPGLKMSLLDPVPEVRAVSARALGAMVRGMGESSFDDLLPWLMQTLTSESSVVDRSGAAQGLSEVVGGLGVEKLHKLMPEIIATAERNDIAPHVKDGYIMMFIYMPAAFPQEFTPYIGQIINPILKALADENEYVRDTALKAGQRIVNLYAETAVALLLPELEKGLFDDNWRIRYSSVQLLGDLLYRISGVSGKMTTETASEDDNFGTEQSHQAIIRFLGEERRNRVLSGLYMGRSDVSLMVRQAALHVWKIVVTNTPRTLREILPTLFSLLLGCLASTSYDKRQVAARTLGDLVRKLGERVLPEIIPILERGLNSDQADQRQGVCIGLSEIMASTSKDMVLLFVNSLVPTVRKALSDPLPEVREAAAKTFESLHSTVGSRALDDILPAMLEGLSDPDPAVAENTLDGLRQVVSIKSKVVLPYLVPQLTTAPVNTKALSILVSVAGDALTKYLPKILSALLQALSEAQGTADENQELEYSQTVILSVTDETGVRTIMDVLMTSARSEKLTTRKSAASLLSVFCMHTPADYSQYVPQLLRCLLRLMADSDRDILQRSWDALNAVVKTLDPAQQIAHVSDVRQAVRFAASDLKEAELPGFCLPKGITPLLPLFREAILNAAPEEKENAAQGLGEIISLTSAQSLQPSVVHITGPLIRILGDRFNAGVKAAVLETLAILLRKVGVMLKQFLPQLQTTFLKALHDQNRTVRIKAGIALSKLVVIHTRADPLFNEIHSNIKANDDIAVKETMLYALRSIITPAGDKMTDIQKKQIYNTLLSMLSFPDDNIRNAVGGCLGALLKYLGDEQIEEALYKNLLVEDNDDSPLKHGRTVVLYVGLKECPQKLLCSNYDEKIIQFVIQLTTSQKVPIACNAVRSLAYMMQFYMLNSSPIPQTVITAYIRSMNHNSNEVKQLVAKSCNYLAKAVNEEQFALETLKYLVPMLVNGTKEKNGYVKSNSEIALLSILRLRDDETTYQKVYQILETGAKDSLNEVVSKVLRKAVLQPIGKDEELDETLLT